MENETAEVVTEEGVSPQQPAPQPELSVTDLQNLKSIVETAVRRGAFQANELSAVGAVYDRVNAFLGALPKPPAPQEGQEQTQESTGQ